jgi:cytochrome bd-type quinol oxidase subunit 2
MGKCPIAMDDSYRNDKLKKTTKLYWYLFIISFSALSTLSLLAWYSLSFGDDISARFADYQVYSKAIFLFNVISYMVMLLLAAYKHHYQSSWVFYIPHYLLFVLFTFIGFSVLGEQNFHLRKAYNMDGGGFSINGLLSIGLSVIALLMSVLVSVGVILLKRKR